jgi:hypothetical protein
MMADGRWQLFENTKITPTNKFNYIYIIKNSFLVFLSFLKKLPSAICHRCAVPKKKVKNNT